MTSSGFLLFHRGVVVSVLDCDNTVSEFEPQSRYYVLFWINTLGKGINPFILPAMGLIVLLLLFCKDGFGIKQSKKIDMQLKTNKENESILKERQKRRSRQKVEKAINNS